MESAIYYYGVALVLTIFIVSITKRKKTHLQNPPPSPPRLPIIGHLHLLKPPLHESLSRLAALHGPALLLCFGIRRVLHVSSLAAADDCFTTNDSAFSDRPLLLFGKHFGYDHTALFVAPYGDHWRRLRRLATVQIFSTARVDAAAAVRACEVRFMLRQLFRGAGEGLGFSAVEMKSRLSDLTYNVAMEMIAGKRYAGDGATSDLEGGRRLPHLIAEAFSLSGSSNMEDFLPWLRWVGMGVNRRRMVRLQSEIDAACQEIIEERRSDFVDGHEAKDTLIDALLSLQKTDPDYYNDQLVKGLIQTIIAGGTDTSSATIEWVMSLLLNQPEELTKVRAEIDMHVGNDRLVNETDLHHLRHLHNVIKETFRLFPPAPLLLPRQSTADCTVAGFGVPRGTMLVVNAHAIQRDPKLWADPDEFKPERFEAAAGEGVKILPFGLGRRKCPGEGLAMRMIGLGLGALLQCFEWERVGKEMVDLTGGSGLTMPKLKPLEAMYRPRKEMIRVLSQL